MGSLALRGLHPEQQPELPAGVWSDAVWAAWVDLMVRIDGQERLDALQETWDGLYEPLDAFGEGPSMDDWGTSTAAQQAQQDLMAMFPGGQ